MANKMIEVKTADMIGPALDWAVAKAVGKNVRILSANNPDGKWQVQCEWRHDGPFWPSQDWAQGGPLIDEHKIGVGPVRGGWVAYPNRPNEPTDWLRGETPLVAICRAIVSDKLGDVVSVPAELVGE